MTEAKGHYHPLTIAQRDIARIFSEMGFALADGKEIISEEENFDVLNVPKDHPARDMHDTFWIKGQPGVVLRTHISSMQVPYLRGHGPEVRMISSGAVYRYEATDATHESLFHYTEGLMVGKNVTLAHLKGTLERFFSEFFGGELTARLRPSFFPFVEPGLEVDMSCFKCEGKGCNICKGTGWVEVMGAGMVHPRVLLNAGINPRDYRGFAFGTGVNRLAMLKYGIDDIRLFYGGDLRLTNQF
jgi:phenylalanyl-tRNA synthetase alpha chain